MVLAAAVPPRPPLEPGVRPVTDGIRSNCCQLESTLMNHLSTVSLRGIVDVAAFAQSELCGDQEIASFAEFKAAYKSTGSLQPVDDITLLRFLAADAFSVELAVERLQQCLAWRKLRKVDALLAVPSPRLRQYNTLRIRRWLGCDRAGQPVLLERLGEFMASGAGLDQPLSKEDWMDCYIWDIEQHFVKMAESSLSRGEGVRKFVYLADAGGMAWNFASARRLGSFVKLLRACTESVERHYPEMAARIILMNVPRVAAFLHNKLVKHFLDPVIADKIELCSGIPTERLLEIMDVSVLPVEYGGENEIVLPHVVPWKEYKEGDGDAGDGDGDGEFFDALEEQGGEA